MSNKRYQAISCDLALQKARKVTAGLKGASIAGEVTFVHEYGKKYRFFFHYHKQKKAMSVHYRGTCSTVKDVICKVRCETKWNKIQPMLVMRGFAKEVIIDGDTATIV